MPARHEAVLLGHVPCGADVITMRFSRPDGFDFAAGQWLILTLETAEGRQTKTFTICSAPSDDYLEITTRLSGSAFKKALAALGQGEHVVIQGPGGHLSIPANLERVCFLAGGVGITPVRSMLRDAAHNGRRFADALLVYGNRDAECVPFADEFALMASNGVRMSLCYEHPPEGWQGASGFISAELVRDLLTELDGVTFYVTGPPVMVSAMERVLDQLKVADEYRVIERFGPPTHHGPAA